MELYGMWSGGVQQCSGRTVSGSPCKNRGYTTDRASGYWCTHHEGTSNANLEDPQETNTGCPCTFCQTGDPDHSDTGRD